MVRYQRNNILFRIASAAAISRFKSIQAHSFGQLNRKEFSFDASAREAVLLSYDRFSQWIYRVERICLSAASSGSDGQTLIPSLISSFVDEQRIAQTIVECNPDIFKNGIDGYLRVIHGYTSQVIHEHFDAISSKRMDEIYSAVVDITSMYLQHILVAMHEFNNNCVTNKEPSFVCMADFCTGLTTDQSRLAPCAQRISYFSKHCNHNTFLFKYYGNDDSAHDSAYNLLSKHCEALNITLVKEDLQIEQEG